MFLLHPVCLAVSLAGAAAYDLYLNGCSTTEIAAALNEEGVRPPIVTGKEWYPASVKCILRNEKYVGDSLMQKYYTADHLRHDSTPNRELVVEQYYKEYTHPGIVPRDVYEDANRIIMMRDCKRGPVSIPTMVGCCAPFAAGRW